MLNHYQLGIAKNNAAVARFLKFQCLDENSAFYGVIPDFIKGYNEPWDGGRQAAHIITAYYNPISAYYRDAELLRRAVLAVDFTLKRLNADGSVDLMECNYHDSTANGFTIKDLGPAILVLQKFSDHTELENILEEKCLELVRASTRAMIGLGFHTPNHRWVLSSALSYCYKITGDESCLDHIKKFLAEGIDCDENGEYTERSSGIYSIVCNSALMIMSENLDMPELRSHVERNLILGMKFFDPDNTVNTLNSTRQDFGKSVDSNSYYDNFLKIALYDGNGIFAYMADEMFARTDEAPDMAFYLLHPEFEAKQAEIVPVCPDLNYEIFLERSGIVRYRKDDVSLTIVKEHPGFCQLQKGTHKMMLRFAGAFFGRGQFIPQTLEKTDDGYKLYMKKEAGYLRPFNEPQKSPLWADMDHSKRETVAVQTLEMSVDIKVSENCLDLDINTVDCGNIPMKLEFIMDSGAILDLGTAEFFTREGDYVYLKSGDSSYTYSDGCCFRFCSAFGEHHWGRTMRDSINGEPEKVTVAMTAISPLSRNIKIKF